MTYYELQVDNGDNFIKIKPFTVYAEKSNLHSVIRKYEKLHLIVDVKEIVT